MQIDHPENGLVLVKLFTVAPEIDYPCEAKLTVAHLSGGIVWLPSI